MRFTLRKKSRIGMRVPPYRQKLVDSLMVLFWIGLGAVICFYFIDIRVRPTLAKLAEAKARQLATYAINQAVHSGMSRELNYQNLIHVNFNEDGKISFIQPNTGFINRVYSEATVAVQRSLDHLPPFVIRVPLGQVFGARILSAYGPELPVKVIPVGLVESVINDRFDQAGINQTRHRIYLTVKAIIKTVVPLVDQEVHVKTDILLTEAIIVGDVPSVYAGNGGVILPAHPMTPAK